jgi:PAS domain S-box-containing protein
MNNSPAVAWAKDDQGRHVYLNHTYEKRFGVRLEDWRGKTDFELWPPEIAEQFRKNDQAVLATGKTLKIAEGKPNPDGSRSTWLNLKFPFTDASGRRYVGGIGLDITERQQAQERLTAALREKEVLLKEIHHRVKNNMQVISSLVSLQADGAGNETVRNVLGDVNRRVRSMALVHEKLYQSSDLARIDFAEYARSLLGHLWGSYGHFTPGIQLKMGLEPVLLPVDLSVPCALILNELVSNALKHAFPKRNRGEGVVTVWLRRLRKGRISLGVRDNGVGLPAGFDWRQARTLGLRLVQMLAGQIDAAVEISGREGTEFTITFGRQKE